MDMTIIEAKWNKAVRENSPSYKEGVARSDGVVVGRDALGAPIEAVLLGRSGDKEITVSEQAEHLGESAYEVLTGYGRRRNSYRTCGIT